MKTPPPPTLESLIADVNDTATSPLALDRLERAVALSRRLDELKENLVGHFVDASRREGASWSLIGERLGVSRQAVQQRFIPSEARVERDDGFWSRVTDDFKVIVSAARECAQARQKRYLGTEHLLLGLAQYPRDPASAVLASLGVDAGTLKAAVQGRVGIASGDASVEETPFTAKALRALQLSLREALRLDADEVETVHLLLGLVAMEEGLAYEILTNLGVVRESLVRAVGILHGR